MPLGVYPNRHRFEPDAAGLVHDFGVNVQRASRVQRYRALGAHPGGASRALRQDECPARLFDVESHLLRYQLYDAVRQRPIEKRLSRRGGRAVLYLSRRINGTSLRRATGACAKDDERVGTALKSAGIEERAQLPRIDI